MNQPNSNGPVIEYQGICPVCMRSVLFSAKNEKFRDSLVCPSCSSVPRERALALVLNEKRPNWRALAIHECSPAERGISHRLRSDAHGYIATHFFPDKPLGSIVRGFRNENLEAQTFADSTLDLVVTLDVMEHLFDPEAAHREIWRTLRPGGLHICTFPIGKSQGPAIKWRAKRDSNGSIEHLAPAEYHGNPIGGGALVTVDYGYDIHKHIAEWAPFDVSVVRTANKTAGVLGEMTDVVVCEKRPT
ncbi:MAG: methyltransferase domain-containing protein [Hyphomonadaceae bacterium]